jgi:hypothetical protein
VTNSRARLLAILFGEHRPYSSVETVVTDVTRMQGDKVCLAMLHAETVIRVHEPTPTEGWLRSIGGLSPGDELRLTCRPDRVIAPPHVEDHEWNPQSVVKIGHLSRDQLVQRLEAAAFATVRDAFGEPAFYSDSGNAAFSPRRGKRSLATLTAREVRIHSYRRGVRADFSDLDRAWTMAPLEDLAMRTRLAALPLSEIEGGALLRIGLGRPFSYADRPAACYLQVNHIIPLASQRRSFAAAQGARS